MQTVLPTITILGFLLFSGYVISHNPERFLDKKEVVHKHRRHK